MKKNKGWRYESDRHSLASKGIKTALKMPYESGKRKINDRSMNKYLSHIMVDMDFKGWANDMYKLFIESEAKTFNEWFELEQYKDKSLPLDFISDRLASISDELLIQYLDTKGIRRWQIVPRSYHVTLIDNSKEGKYLVELRTEEWSEVDFEFMGWVENNKEKYQGKKKKFAEDVERWFRDKSKQIVEESIREIKKEKRDVK